MYICTITHYQNKNFCRIESPRKPPNAILSNALTNGIPEWYMRLSPTPAYAKSSLCGGGSLLAHITLSLFVFFVNWLAKVAHLGYPLAIKVDALAYLCASFAPDRVA